MLKRKKILFFSFTVLLSLLLCSCEFVNSFFKVETETLNLDTEEYTFTNPEQSLQLNATILPEKATDKSVIWLSSDDSIVSVTESGVIRPLSSGVAVVTAKAAGGRGISACTVNVNFYVPVNGISLDQNLITFENLLETKQLKATITPENATNPHYIWSSGDVNVATVNENGLVTSIGNGETLIEAHSEDGNLIAVCSVVVNSFVEVEDVEFDIQNFTFSSESDTLILTPQFVPANTTEKGLTWSSSDEKVATVNSDGEVKPVGNGTATISALTDNKKKIARCKITVKMPVAVSGISLEKNEYTLNDIGLSYQLPVKIEPASATNVKITYTSSDTNVAVVNENGIIKSVGEGTANIKASTSEGNYSTELKLTVTKPEIKTVEVKGLKLKEYKKTFLAYGDTYKIEPIIEPSDAENKNVSYSSSDESIATVDSLGNIKAVSYGIAIITVKTQSGGFSESFYVVVENPSPQTGTIPNENPSYISKVVTDGTVRGVWVSTVNRIDFPSASGLSAEKIRAEIVTILNNVESYGLNTVFFQVRPKSDALYISSVYPSSDVIVPKQGDPLPIDPLAVFIEEAHKRGIELHAWINPYRITQSGNNGHNLEILAATHPARLHPEWVVKHTDGGMYFNPGIPEVRELIIKGIEEIVRNYDVDGIHFDDYFYPATKSSEFKDDTEYALYGGGMSKSDWRRHNNDTLVLSISQSIKVIKPSVKFGISPGGIWAMKSYNSLGTEGLNGTSQTHYDVFADTRKWVVNEWIDYICPQIYWQINHSKAPYKPIAQWWADLCATTKVELYIGHAAYRAADTDAFKTNTEIRNQLDYMKTVKKYNGSVFFTYSSLKNNLGNIVPLLQELYLGTIENPEEVKITPAVPASESLVLYQKKLSAEASDNSAFILGVSDPNKPLTANGEAVERTAQGYFAYYVKNLITGENIIKFEHKGQNVNFVITKKQATTASKHMDKFGFVSNSFSPRYDYAALSGSTLNFSCNATAGSTVYVMLGSYRIDLKTSTKPSTDGKLLIAYYSADFTFPQSDGNIVLGTPVFYAEMNGKTEKYTATNVIEIINNPDNYIVEIINDKCDLIPNLSLTPESYYVGTLGVRDAVVSKSKGYAKLKSGLYISTSDIKRVDGTFAAASLANISVVNGGKYTHVIIPVDSKANHSVWMYDDRSEITIYNLNSTSALASLSGDNPLFNDVSIKKVDETTIKIILPYKKSLHIFGYYAAFDGSRLVINFKNPVGISSGGLMLSGIKISLDPGHSDSTGALGPWGSIKFYEAEYNLTLSKKVRDRLEALGATVKMTHTGEGIKNLDSLIVEYRLWQPDINVSIHFNSTTTTANPNTINGTETFYCYNNSKLLASTLLDSFTSLTGFKKRYSKVGYYKVSRLCEFPSVLFETAYMSNPGDFEWFTSDENMDIAATAIVAGIVSFFSAQSN